MTSGIRKLRGFEGIEKYCDAVREEIPCQPSKFPEQFSSVCSYYLLMSTTAPFGVTRLKQTPCSGESEGVAKLILQTRKPYRNLYQIASYRNMSQYAGTCLFLGKPQKMHLETGEGSPISTLASNLRFD